MIKISKIFKNPYRIIVILGSHKMLNFLPDMLYLKLMYRGFIGNKLDLEKPKTFNEKIQWLKLYNRKNEYTNLVDKYEVRKYISQKIGEEYLIPLIDVWNNVEDIDFDKLPNQYVLKCTHDSGGIVICKDKNNFNIINAKNKLSNSLKTNYFNYSREWVYKNINPKIIAEKYMNDGVNYNLNDYKFMVFNGKVKCSFVCSNRNSGNSLNVDFFDLNWEHMPFNRHYPCNSKKINKPHNYEKMIELAEILANNISFLRVDFYEIQDKIYFGELTFFPGSGFEEFTPILYDEILGEWLQLPEKVTKYETE